MIVADFRLTNKIKMIEDLVRDKAVINGDVIGEVEKIYGDFNELIIMIGNKKRIIWELH